nr:hypothetical protein CFP56_39023 [Quercus suber]
MSIPSRTFSYNSTMDRSNASDMIMDSDEEVTSTAGSDERSSGVNRWLGERYFDLLLSKEVAKWKTNRSPGIDLDVGHKENHAVVDAIDN